MAAALLAALTATLILLVGALVVRIHHLLHALVCDATQRAPERRWRWSPIVPTQACSAATSLRATHGCILDLRLLLHDRFGDARERLVGRHTGPAGVVLLRCSRRRTAMERRPAQRVCPAWLGLGDKKAMV
jgi:hypothetical protein